MIRFLTIIVVSLVLLTGCQWIEPPPDMLGDAYMKGARHGCLRTLYNLFGPPSDIWNAMDRITHCESMAVEAAGINDAAPKVEPQSQPLKRQGDASKPGSWM